jgi:hypothetical protein
VTAVASIPRPSKPNRGAFMVDSVSRQFLRVSRRQEPSVRLQYSPPLGGIRINSQFRGL